MSSDLILNSTAFYGSQRFKTNYMTGHMHMRGCRRVKGCDRGRHVLAMRSEISAMYGFASADRSVL